MVMVVALVAACALGLLSLRSMALALGRTVDVTPELTVRHSHPVIRRSGYLRSTEAAMLICEILLSAGIAAAVVGLASMAALPGRLIVGALLAQVAIVGALVAPAVSVPVGPVRLQPAAIALGLAQLANVVFFAHAIQALI